MVSPELVVGAGLSVAMQALKAGPLRGAEDGAQRAVLAVLCLGGALGYGAAFGGLTPASLATLDGSAMVVMTAVQVAMGAVVTWVGFFRDGRPKEEPKP